MRPVRLELEGFGAFREPAAVDFTDIELVALVGNTGAGKSTLIDAITFALYGSVARYDDRKVVAPVINQTSTRARVRLDFELGATPYTAARLVQRTPKGATTKEARLECAGEVLSSDAKAMTAEVTRLLGLDVDQFNRTVVLPQGRFADFLHDNPADRQATLRQLLGFDVYRRIAVAARQRATVARNQLDALRPDLDAADAELTADRRAALEARHDELSSALASFLAIGEVLATLDGSLDALDALLGKLEEELVLLATAAAPDELAELDQRSKEAEAAVERSVGELVAAQQRRRDADQRATDGPDPATCRLQLLRHADAVAAGQQHGAAVRQLTAADARQTVAVAAADDVVTAQARLDEAVAAAAARVRSTRRAAEHGPDRSRVEHAISRHLRRAATAEAARRADIAAADARALVPPAASAASMAEDEVVAARARRDEVREHVGVAGYVHLLALGAPCPLCQREVEALPNHHLDADLAAADVRLATAMDVAARAADHAREVDRRAVEQSAEAAAAARALRDLDDELEGVADIATLQLQLAEADSLVAARALAEHDLDAAETAASAHRADIDNVRRLSEAEAATTQVTRLRALEEAQRAHLEILVAELADLPPEAVLRTSLEAAERLAGEQRSAIDHLHDVEAAHRSAVAERDEVAVASAIATRELHAARDRLSSLGPPSLSGDRVADEFATLLAWASALRVERLEQRVDLLADRSAAADRRSTADHELRTTIAAVLGDADGPLGALRDRLTRAEESAAREVVAFDGRRATTEALRRRVDGLDADRAVADELGRLLRADGFEAWLMGAALDELAEGASTRLRELSSGQFSLEVVDRDLMVRDHANADELRSARTLSGGETFLAALALSLALSDATAELSTEGGSRIESIFLDEGFGTLDPDTLDVVATTIEELGSAGRMVAVVTHLRELADRMPVRLEVARDATTATVRRIDL